MVNEGDNTGDDELDLHEVDIASLHAPEAPPAPEEPPVSESPDPPVVELDDVDELLVDAPLTADAFEAEAARQRRENVRINIRCPVTIRIDGHEPMRSRARDMSATGVGFSTRLPLDIDSVGRVTIHFDGWTFSKEFVVRFCRPIIAGKHIGAEFNQLTQDEHERIVKQVFSVQREELRLERLRAKQ
jgi:hypothetical protein